MATLTTTATRPSLFGGVVIIGGTIIGAGMFSLPVVMSGAWFFWSLAALVFTWFCMLHSGLMILEANLNYRIGSSFDTITKDLLGKGWNLVNGVSIAFVLYILTYAYISASGSILNHTFSELSLKVPAPADNAPVLPGLVWLSRQRAEPDEILRKRSAHHHPLLNLRYAAGAGSVCRLAAGDDG